MRLSVLSFQVKGTPPSRASPRLSGGPAEFRGLSAEEGAAIERASCGHILHICTVSACATLCWRLMMGLGSGSVMERISSHPQPVALQAGRRLRRPGSSLPAAAASPQGS